MINPLTSPTEFTIRLFAVAVFCLVYAWFLTTEQGREWDDDPSTRYQPTAIGILGVLVVALWGYWIALATMIAFFAPAGLFFMVRATLLHFKARRTRQIDESYHAAQDATRQTATLR